ncbi:hypothetical protein DFH09DRAFT_1069620 [Mycena vulgaris]|nr:hypothetical protein DFH09DRAFT_1069620 [Mycena vulgaris]
MDSLYSWNFQQAWRIIWKVYIQWNALGEVGSDPQFRKSEGGRSQIRVDRVEYPQFRVGTPVESGERAVGRGGGAVETQGSGSPGRHEQKAIELGYAVEISACVDVLGCGFVGQQSLNGYEAYLRYEIGNWYGREAARREAAGEPVRRIQVFKQAERGEWEGFWGAGTDSEQKQCSTACSACTSESRNGRSEASLEFRSGTGGLLVVKLNGVSGESASGYLVLIGGDMRVDENLSKRTQHWMRDEEDAARMGQQCARSTLNAELNARDDKGPREPGSKVEGVVVFNDDSRASAKMCFQS